MVDGPRLNEFELKVLESIASVGDWDFRVRCFEPIQRETGLDRKVVRRACRSLARKGLAKYHRGCWTDEGRPAGSGYGATEKGRLIYEELFTTDL